MAVELGNREEPETSDESHDDTRNKISARNWLNLGAYVANSVVTYVSLTGVFGETNTDLSKKYQTLVTPAGFAFSIWGPIFITEGIFVIAQLFPRFARTDVVKAVSPFWWSACLFQVVWTLAFAQEVIWLALAFMLGILVSLLGLAWATDGLQMPSLEYWLLRAPFSLHLGWIIAASAVNTNVQADSNLAPPETLLGLAVASYAIVTAACAVFACATKTPDPIVCLVAAWAFLGIQAELGNPENLDSPTRHNPYVWPRVILEGLRNAAQGVGYMALIFALIASAYRLTPFCIGRKPTAADAEDV